MVMLYTHIVRGEKGGLGTDFHLRKKIHGKTRFWNDISLKLCHQNVMRLFAHCILLNFEHASLHWFIFFIEWLDFVCFSITFIYIFI